MNKVAIILSGCGVYDGAEIHESVLTLLALTRENTEVQFLAPNIEQMHVINHLTGDEQEESRNVLVESARIARGNILDITKADPIDYDACIFPGGFGAAKNLCNFAIEGENTEINPNIWAFAKAMNVAKKPIGFICIAPAMIPKIIGNDVSLTIGDDVETAEKIEAMGGIHVDCSVDEIVVDEEHKIVSTPAYMLAENIIDAEAGINLLVERVLDMID